MDNFRNEHQKQMVIDNMRLVFMIVGKFKVSKFSMDYDEYVSNGTFGLIKAVLTFENDRNISFSTYATKCITNEILMGIRKQKNGKTILQYIKKLKRMEKMK